LIGDFILVNKFSYGIRLPVLDTKVIEIGKPQRGDVVVFRYPEDPSIPFIKRVIGLPGDLVEYHHASKVVYINNEPIEQTDRKRATYRTSFRRGRACYSRYSDQDAVRTD